MNYWLHVKSTLRHKSLVVKLLRDVDSGQFVAPKALEAMTRYRTEDLSLKGRFRAHMELPEKALTIALLKQYPEAKSEPVALDSFNPPVSRRFVQRQLHLMQQGATQAAAFEQTQHEMAGQLQDLRTRQLRAASGSSSLAQLQLEEQEQLDAGIEELATQRLSQPASPAARLAAAGAR